MKPCCERCTVCCVILTTRPAPLDLSHLLDAPGLQLWVLEEGGHIKAALLLVMEGDIDPDLHEAIVSKQRRLPHQLLPQLLAQSADQSQALQAVYGQSHTNRRCRAGTQAWPRNTVIAGRRERPDQFWPACQPALAQALPAMHASIAFWQKNGYARFPYRVQAQSQNRKTGNSRDQESFTHPGLGSADSRVPFTRTISFITTNSPDRPDTGTFDATLLRRFARKANAACTIPMLHCADLPDNITLPLHKESGISRREYEAALRKAVAAVLL